MNFLILNNKNNNIILSLYSKADTMRKLFIILLLPIVFSCNNPVMNIQKGINNLVTGQNEIKNEIVQMKNNIEKLAINDSIMNRQLQFYPSAVPVNGDITSKYQTRIDPIDGDKKMHLGIDIRAPKGSPVVATATGMVESVNTHAGQYGQRIIINHYNGYKSIFGHLSKMYVKEGQTVVRGDTIGLVGNTGKSTGSHLHYEISFKGNKVSPGIFREQFKASELNMPSLYYSQL